MPSKPSAKTCLIIGNGPSLADVPNEFLAKYPTFGTSRVYLKYVPDYYAFVDPVSMNDDRMHEIRELKSAHKFVDSHYNHLFNDCIPLKCLHEMGFSLYPLSVVYAYFSATTVLIQLAFYYGFEKVGLVGMDHRYATPNGKRKWHEASEDTSHFTSDYYKPGESWKAPMLDKLTVWHGLAREVFDCNHRQIVNLTPGSDLTVHPMEDWRTW